MNVIRLVYFSLDITHTCWGLRQSKQTLSKHTVRVQYPVVIQVVKACLITWEHRGLFLGLFERKSGAFVGRVLPCARTPQRMAACALHSSLVWIQGFWRIKEIWEYFLDWGVRWTGPIGCQQHERHCFSLVWVRSLPFFFTPQDAEEKFCRWDIVFLNTWRAFFPHLSLSLV